MFDITAQPKVAGVHGWYAPDTSPPAARRFFAVLRVRPVDFSPAVQASMAKEAPDSDVGWQAQNWSRYNRTGTLGPVVPPFIKTVLAVGAAVASAAVGLSRLEIPKDFWNDKSRWLVGCVLYLAGWSVYETVDRAIAGRRAKREKRQIAVRREAEQILKGVLVNVSQTTGLDWTRIGVHLFLVETKWRWWPWPFRYQVQARVVKVKMSEYPPSTGITWTKGKGVIGRCWAKKAFVGKDLRATYARYRVASKADWNRLGPAVRFGLSYDEFVSTREHAGTVFAAPVREPDGEYLGCVSLDAPGNCYSVLNTHPIKERLQAAASYIAPRVAKKSGE